MTDRFAQALAYAAQVHRGHARKSSGVPYVAHLLAVCALVLEDGGSEDEAIAALLHDAVEDRRAEPRDIEARFGRPVADLVAEVTEPPKERPWRERKEAYLAHLEIATPGALRISLADKLHNARSLRAESPEIWAALSAPVDEQRWLYFSLLDVYRRRAPGPHVAELEQVVADLFP